MSHSQQLSGFPREHSLSFTSSNVHLMKCCVNCCLNVEDPPQPHGFEHLVYPWCCQGSLLALLEVKPHRRRTSAPEGGPWDFVAQWYFLFPLCFLTLHMNGLNVNSGPLTPCLSLHDGLYHLKLEAKPNPFLLQIIS